VREEGKREEEKKKKRRRRRKRGKEEEGRFQKDGSEGEREREKGRTQEGRERKEGRRKGQDIVDRSTETAVKQGFQTGHMGNNLTGDMGDTPSETWVTPPSRDG